MPQLCSRPITFGAFEAAWMMLIAVNAMNLLGLQCDCTSKTGAIVQPLPKTTCVIHKHHAIPIPAGSKTGHVTVHCGHQVSRAQFSQQSGKVWMSPPSPSPANSLLTCLCRLFRFLGILPHIYTSPCHLD